MSNSKFKQGSGCYTCEICQKRTRDTGLGEADNGLLCVLCFTVEGLRNSLSDHGHPNPWKMFKGLKSVDEVEAAYQVEFDKHCKS